jgi:hypothetical protein
MMTSVTSGRRGDGVDADHRRPLDGLPVSGATHRWACAVGRVVAASRDIPTLADWANVIGVSRRCLCSCCDLASAPAKASLDLGRLARTLRFPSPDGWRPEECLLSADPRTVVALLDRTGVRAYHRGQPPTVAQLLRSSASGLPPRVLDALLQHLGPLVRFS